MNTRELLDELQDSDGYYYLATPYSKYVGGLTAAFEDACRHAAALMENKVTIYCPIAHTHPIATHGDINPRDHDIWIPLDKRMMDSAVGLVVCCLMYGWDESYGVEEEINEFYSAGKPVLYWDAT